MENKKCSRCEKVTTPWKEVQDTIFCVPCSDKMQDDGDIYTCSYCVEQYIESEDNSSNALDGTICTNCYEEHYTMCLGCDDIVLNVNVWNLAGDDYCRHCYDNREGCSDETFDETFSEVLRRPNIRNTSFQCEEKGNIITSSRKFGVEIEMLNEEFKNLRRLNESIAQCYGFEQDSSLSGADVEIELQTPPMSGKKGETEIVELLKTQ